MGSWEDKVRQAKSGQFSPNDRQRGRVVMDIVERKERTKDLLSSYGVWIGGAIPTAIVIAKLFLDHGAK